MHIEQIKVSALVAYANNSRTHSEAQIAKIALSIQEFGFCNPVLIDEDNVLIAGHGRTMAAAKLGLDEVPAIRLLHLTEAQRRAFVIADNRLAEDAGWDDELLRIELAALDAYDFDLSVIGFEDQELATLLGESPSVGLTEPDHVPAMAAELVTVRGDVFVLGRHRLVCGDSTKQADVDRLLAGETAECLWTDPPYNVAYEGAAGKIKNDDMGDGAFREFLRAAFTCAFRALKPGGAAYVAHADTEGLNFRAAFREAGFKLSSCVIWKKNALVLGRSDYQWQHEPILYGWKEGAAHRWYGARNKTTIQEFEENPLVQIDETRWQIQVGDSLLLIEGDNLSVTEHRGSVVSVKKPKRNGVHPTMKPVELVIRFLLNSTTKGDSVLDLFGGSGSTLIACEMTGRKARLCELDEKFCDVIIRRWQEFTGLDAVRERDGLNFNELAGAA